MKTRERKERRKKERKRERKKGRREGERGSREGERKCHQALPSSYLKQGGSREKSGQKTLGRKEGILWG